MYLDFTDEQLSDAYYASAKEDTPEAAKIKAEMIRRKLLAEA